MAKVSAPVTMGFGVLAAAMVSAGAARANIDLSTYAGHLDNSAGGVSPELYQLINLPPNYLGPPSHEATSGTSPNGASWDVSAQASFGVLRVLSTGSALGGGIENTAVASFEDEVVFNNLPAGTAGVATFQLHLTGELSASGGGFWDYATSFEQDGADRQMFTGDSYKEALDQDVDRTLTFTLNFVSGVAQHIRLLTSVTTGDFFVPGSATGDFSHTALWGGLQSVVVGGHDVTRSVDIVSSSGFNYEAAASEGVPEPASWALMIVGLGGAGALLRRRRAAQAQAALA